jgi:glycosyltransferase involved in cell wall biosynthesis
MSPRRQANETAAPDLSLVLPCYNEEQVVEYTITRLIAAFEQSRYQLQLVPVDNGSKDRTGEILAELAGRFANVCPHTLEENQGYGGGLLSGVPKCTGAWIGFIPADGQVDAEDVVRLFDALATAPEPMLGKVRRRFRMDGLWRKAVSVSYNVLVRILWPRLGSIDVNGTPKILPRQVLQTMRLKSRDWFLDPEIMIKAHHMGIRVLELNAFARLRSAGLSHVRASTCFEFFWNLLQYRFSGEIGVWKRELEESPPMGVSVE